MMIIGVTSVSVRLESGRSIQLNQKGRWAYKAIYILLDAEILEFRAKSSTRRGLVDGGIL